MQGTSSNQYFKDSVNKVIIIIFSRSSSTCCYKVIIIIYYFPSSTEQRSLHVILEGSHLLSSITQFSRVGQPRPSKESHSKLEIVSIKSFFFSIRNNRARRSSALSFALNSVVFLHNSMSCSKVVGLLSNSN